MPAEEKAMRIRFVGLVFARKCLARNCSIIIGNNGFGYFVDSSNVVIGYCDNACLKELASENDYVSALLK